MNVNMILNMVMRIIMRKAVNKGINAGIKGASGLAARGRGGKKQQPPQGAIDDYGNPTGRGDSLDDEMLRAQQRARRQNRNS